VIRLLILALAIAAIAPAAEARKKILPQSDTAVWHETGCPWVPESGRRLDCGVLEVPENRDDPESRTIYIHVRVFRAQQASGKPPVVFLNGGPGQGMDFDSAEGIDGWDSYLDGTMGWTRDRDVVLFAQRGTLVNGVGMECPQYGDPRIFMGATEQPGPPTDWVANVIRADEECRAKLARQDYDLAGYSSTENARDVIALRRALGIERWMLYGVSYGTRLGFEILRQDPGAVESAVFDSVFPPQISSHWHDPDPFADALDALLVNCADDTRCARAFPRLAEDLETLLARLAVDPVAIHVDDPRGRLPRLHFEVDDIALIDMIFYNLYWTEGIEVLPAAIDALARGDLDRFREQLAEPYMFDPLFSGWAFGMQAAVNCNDDFAFYEEAEMRRAVARHPRLSNWLSVVFQLPACRGWPVQPREAGFSQPVRSDVPVLMLAGALDPVTPPSYAEAALAHLPNGQLHVIPGAAHSVLDSESCARRLVAQFADEPGVPLPRLCEGRRPVFSFVLP
jgi:pimeloyl-ACP methyl ester carboxylesterase